MTENIAHDGEFNLEEQAITAAGAAAEVLPSAEPLIAGRFTDNFGNLAMPEGNIKAVSATFSGSIQGQIMVVVGGDLADALAGSSMGELDLAAAIQPAIAAAANNLGTVMVDTAQIVEGDNPLGNLIAPSLGAVPLLAGPDTGAVVAFAIESTSSAAASIPRIDSHKSRSGLELLNDVEMEVTAELGRTRMTVKELLSLSPGTVVELDRAAGSPSDLLVNGRLIARGEVVVVDEDFGIRITEIVSTPLEAAA